MKGHTYTGITLAVIAVLILYCSCIQKGSLITVCVGKWVGS